MDTRLKTDITKFLKEEFEKMKKIENNSGVILDIMHIIQVIQNYEELEPMIANYLNEKAEREKYNR